MGRALRVAGYAALLAVLLFPVLMYFDHPISGFHTMNESFYSSLARTYSTQPPLEPLLRPIDTNNPPLYPYVQSLAVRAGLEPVLGGRVVSFLSMMVAALMLCLIARRVLPGSSGWAAPLMLLCSPMAALMARHVQVESLYAALSLSAVAAWLAARERLGMRGLWLASAAGLLLGLAASARVVAVLMAVPLLVLDLTAPARPGGIGSRVAPWAAAAAGFVAGALPSVPGFLNAGDRIPSLLRFAYLSSPQAFLRYTDEAFAVIGLAMIPFLVLGTVMILFERVPSRWFLLSGLAVSMGFYAFFNKHSYYFFMAIPWLALVAAAGVSAVGRVWGRRVMYASVAVAVLVSGFMNASLFGDKLVGRWTVGDAAATVESRGVPISSVVARGILASTEDPRCSQDVFSYYGVTLPATTATEPVPAGTAVLTWDEELRPSDASTATVQETLMSPVAFGHKLVAERNNPNFLAASWRVAPAGIAFGMERARRDSFLVLVLPRDRGSAGTGGPAR